MKPAVSCVGSPFNPATKIKYQFAGATDVRLTVYDMLGREVATLVNQRQPARLHKQKNGAHTVNKKQKIIFNPACSDLH